MKKLLFVFFVLFLFSKANAQQFTGTVLDNTTKEPIPFVSIVFPTLKTGTSTDINGIFTIDEVKKTVITIQISSIGYTTIETTIDISKYPKKTFYLTESHYQLDEVVIAAPTGKLQKSTIVSVQHQKLEKLQVSNPLTLAESISNLAGVAQNTTGVGIGKPVIRGLSGSRIVTYAQGIRIENQQWGDEHGLGVGEIGIGSVEVIKGPASLLYGADALGGVLFFVDEAYANHNTSEIGVQTKWMSNTLGSSTDITYKLHQGKLKWNLFGGYDSHADYKIPNGKRVKNTRFNQKNIKTSFGFNTDNWVSNLRYSYLQNYFGITEGANYSTSTKRNFELPFQIINNHNVSFENNFSFPDSSLKTIVGYTSNYRREFEDDKTVQALGMYLNTFTYNVKWGSPLYKDVFDFLIGSQGMYQTNKNNGDEILIPNTTTKDIGAYVLGNASFNQVHFQTGIRLDQRTINAQQTQHIAGLQKTYHGFTFSGGVAYQQESSKWRANISSGFRAPTTSELLSDGVHEGTNRYEKGNALLSTEKATQIDVAYNYNSEHFQFSINPFYNHIKNYVFLSPTNTQINNNPVFKYSQTNASLYGGEMGVHFHPHSIHGLHIESDVSTVFAKDDAGNSLPLIPQTKINSMVSFEFFKKHSFSVSKIYLQHIYKFKQTNVGAFETPTNSYQLVNLGASFRIKTNNQPIKMNIGVKNVFNTNYIDHLSRFKKLGVSNTGINAFFSISYSLIRKISK